MLGQEEPLSWGYCIRCTAYVRGWPIEDRDEAVDGHQDCPATRPETDDPAGLPAREQFWRSHRQSRPEYRALCGRHCAG